MTVAPALRPDVADETRPEPLMSLFDSVATALLDAPELPEFETEPDFSRSHLRRSRPVPTEQRPWAPWRVRITFVVSFVVVGIPISALMLWFWSHSRPAHGPAAEVVDGISYVWVVLAVPVLLNVIGALTFRNANTKQSHDMPLGSEVCFRIVTRGTNIEAVCKTARAVQAAMAHTPLFPYSIEIVTDNPLPVVDGVRKGCSARSRWYSTTPCPMRSSPECSSSATALWIPRMTEGVMCVSSSRWKSHAVWGMGDASSAYSRARALNRALVPVR